MPDQEENRAPAPTKKKSSFTLVLVIVAAVIGVLALGLYYAQQPTQPASAAGPGGIAATLPLETFVVNLSAPGERAYLRIGISLGLSRPLPRNKEEIPVALVRDTILSVLSAAHADQLVQAEGKRQLKNELLLALQDRVPQLGVQDVYFTEFLVQM